MRRVHFIGIGGTGLSAMAMVLLQRGWQVSGSDRQSAPSIQPLQAAGARLFDMHSSENVAGADVVVRSSAVQDDNPEVLAALAAGIPVLKRREFLAILLNGQEPVAVAGTHGKTTTTAMIAWILFALGLDPSCVIGSTATNLGSNARSGAGRYFVIEADEYDRMFLGIRPSIAVVTNIEYDHPDCFPTPEDFRAAFQEFAGQILPGGGLIVCGDDPWAAGLLAEVGRSDLECVSYGIGPGQFHLSARNLKQNSTGGISFDVVFEGADRLYPVALQVPGEHNVRNGLAALAVAERIGLPIDAAARVLGEFRGTGRRFEERGEFSGIILVDDYAHHPTEIRAVLAAARSRYPGRRIWAVWQPHTYSRTRTLQAGFEAAFEDADCVVVTEVYPAREQPPEDGYSAQSLAASIGKRRLNSASVHFAPGLDDAVSLLRSELRSGDAALILSAGDADRITAQLARELADQTGAATTPSRRNANA